MKKRLRKSIGLAFLILLLALIQPDTILAGEGVYEAGDPDKLTLNVLFQFDSSANFNPNPEWEAVFNKASQLLYNSTDGQLQIGTINFYNNCEQVTPQMDVLIQSGAGGASAHVEGMGVTGLHIFVYQDTHSQDVPAARGHFGVVHELGHYLFGMYDSYIDRNNNPTSCINATSTVATIMDGGTTVQPKNARTEWTL
ncbi:MAG: hypothetical protein JW862_18275, partial [Anaerolineales bacterium]|nr:hypothetical protein [Anaerolineales bacterium]